MTRALTYHEVEVLEPDDLVARYRKIGSIEVGRVLRVMPHTLVIEFEHTGQLRYDRSTGRQLGCKGNQLRTVPEAQAPVEHEVTDLGDNTANVEPNDEAQIVEQVKADRAAAKRMTQQAWLDAFQRYLDERLTWDHATLDERRALQAALSTAGSEPQSILVEHLSKSEVPYYTAGQLSAWVYRQRRDACKVTVVAPTPDFAQW